MKNSNNNVTFSDLANFLRHGREIEFEYKNKQYSITNSHYEWHFCCDTDKFSITLCQFPDFDTLVGKTAKIIIEGITVEEIFDRKLYASDRLSII